VSEYNILQLKFSPINPFILASCGRENIRFWRIREEGNIRGTAVVLNQHSRDTVFTSLDFESGLRSADVRENGALQRLYVGSKRGIIFQVNYGADKPTLEATYKTNDSDIYAVAVNEGFCAIGSADRYIRVWALDFSEFYMEA